MESAASTRVGTRDQDLRSWLLILVLVAGHGIKHMYASGFLLILPEMRLGLALSNSDLGTLATARNLAGSLMNLPAGFLADRSSKQWPMILGITMISIGTLQFIMGTVSSYWPIVICAIFAGASISLWHPAAIAALSQRFADRRGLVISLHGTGGSIGEALGPLVVGGALLWLVWQTVLQASLFPALIGGGLVWWLMRNVQGQGTGTLTMQDYVASLKLLFRTRGLQTVLIVTGLYSFAQGGFVTFLPVYLRIDLEYSTFQAAAFIAAAQVSGIISQPIMGWLSDRFGRAMVLAPSLMLLGIGIPLRGICAGRMAPGGDGDAVRRLPVPQHGAFPRHSYGPGQERSASDNRRAGIRDEFCIRQHLSADSRPLGRHLWVAERLHLQRGGRAMRLTVPVY